MSAKSECWRYKNVILENVKEYIYLGVNLCMNMKWTRHKNKAKVKGIYILNEIRKLKTTIPEIPTQLTDKMFQGLLVPGIAYGAEIWGARNTSMFNTIQYQYLKSTVGMCNSSANYGILWEFGLLPLEITFKIRAIKYWVSIRMNNRNKNVVESFLYNVEGTWSREIKCFLEKLELGYLWHVVPTPNDFKTIIRKIKLFFEREVAINRLEKHSLFVQITVAGRWGRKPYINALNRKEREGYCWFRLGGWKLRKLRNTEDSLCPLCNEHEDWVHILLVCSKTDNYRHFFNTGGYTNTKNFELALKLMRDNRMPVVKSLGNFLSYVREKRTKAILKIENSV